MTINLEPARGSRAWPFREAERLLHRVEQQPPPNGYVLFETGYGPSGLPHIGTFGEVFRTTMVRQAFEKLSGLPTKLIAFSDDMDGLRKVPDNIPNRDMVAQHLGKPLTAIPDPFGTHESFGAHMNSRLQQFLEQYGFDYEFKSATACYTSGLFDQTLLQVLAHYDAVMDVMLPTLGEERQTTYSPFLPLCPKTGKVLQVPVLAHDVRHGTITYRDPEGDAVETPVTGGRCKLQWKPDWGMRWAALGVDYEMHGKDLIPSAALSTQICAMLGATPPLLFAYELFLDETGAKISKSKGNGISIEEWLRYGTPESLALFMFHAPQRAKRLYFDVIPKHVDDYLAYVEKLSQQDDTQQYSNPVWHIHHGKVPAQRLLVNFSLLLNLASACNPEHEAVLWGFISRYAPEISPHNAPLLATLVQRAMVYYEHFVKPQKRYRTPTARERTALEALATRLMALPTTASAEELQSEVYAIGKAHGFNNLRDWFGALYAILLGQEHGPRMGSFIALYGVPETVRLIQHAIHRA